MPKFITAIRILLLRIGLIFFGLLLALLTMELLLHLFPGLLPPAVRQTLAIYDDRRATLDKNKPFIANNELIFAPQVGVDMEIHSGLDLYYNVQTRSLNNSTIGFRDVGVITDVYAVAVGDSLTWGTFVEAEQSWPEQLEALLDVPVVNLGIRGYGPGQYQILTEKYALPFHPKIVIWGIFTGNDFANSAEFAEWQKMGRYEPAFFEEQSGLLDFLSRHVRLYELTKLLRRTQSYQQLSRIVSVSAPGGSDWLFYPDDLQALSDADQPMIAEGWQVTQAAILATATAVHAADAQFVLVIIPPKELIYWDKMRTQLREPSVYDLAEPVRQLTAFCETEALLCLDLTPTLLERTAEGEEFYFRQDAHFNPAGHQLVAELVADYLAAQNLQP